MRRPGITLLGCLLALAASGTQSWGLGAQSDEEVIADAVAAVSVARIDGDVIRLQRFGTRYALHDSCDATAAWVRAELRRAGIEDVSYHLFSATYPPNVVAVLPGTGENPRQILVGAHFDSKTPDHQVCPGADDNASGTAGLIECARVLSAYNFEHTIVFVAFSGEEMGLKGSWAYGRRATSQGDDVVAMINIDTIGYLADGDAPDLHITTNEESRWVLERVQSVAARYVPELPVREGTIPGSYGDHNSFWAQGYPAVMFHEDSDASSPFIHTSGDTVGGGYNSPLLAERCVRVAVAVLADLAGPVGLSRPPSAELAQNYPNPFNGGTTIEYTLAAPGLVTLAVFDVTGARVRTLVNESQHPRPQVFTVRWNGESDTGESVASGVYFCRLSVGRFEQTRRLVFLK